MEKEKATVFRISRQILMKPQLFAQLEDYAAGLNSVLAWKFFLEMSARYSCPDIRRKFQILCLKFTGA